MTPGSHVPTGVLFGLLFTLAGPMRIIPVFSGVAGMLPARDRIRLAAKATALGITGVIVASLMGSAKIRASGISNEALVTSAGLVLALIGLPPLIGWNKPADVDESVPIDALRLAFPTLLPPYAFGLIILFDLYSASFADTFSLIVTGALLMAINFLAMLVSTRVMALIGMTPLRITGAAFGLIQLALGIQMIFWGIKNGLIGSP